MYQYCGTYVVPLPLSGKIQQTTNWCYFSYFPKKTGSDMSCKLSPFGDNLHEMSNSIFWEK